jgi:TnpA family transposase
LISRAAQNGRAGLSQTYVFKKKETACHAVRSCPPPSRSSLLALPDTEDEFIRHYTFSEADLSLIRQHRGDANRLGVAVQLCLLRFPGRAAA